MNRYITIIALMLTASMQATAKEHTSGTRATMPQRQQQTAKTTATKERLIGYSHKRLSDMVITDTATYFYSGSRGSGAIDWGTRIRPYFSDMEQKMKCDSYTYKVGVSEAGRFSYDGAGKMTEMMFYDTTGSGTGTLIPASHRYYFYNSINKVANDSEYYYPYSSIYKTYHKYDASGFLVTDSQYNVTFNQKAFRVLYTNNTAGDILNYVYYTPGPFDPYMRVYYTYDVNGHITTAISQIFTAGNWVNDWKDSMYYPGTSDRYTYLFQFNGSGSSWTPYVKYSLHVNATNQWDSVYIDYWSSGAYVQLERSAFAYTPQGNLQYSTGYLYNAGLGAYESTPNDLNTYYYQVYDDLGAADIRNKQATVHVFPNPVSQMLHVAIDDVPAGQQVTITMTNMLGQNISKSKAGAGTSQIDMSALPAGMYLVVVMGDGVSYTQKVMKYN